MSILAADGVEYRVYSVILFYNWIARVVTGLQQKSKENVFKAYFMS